MWHHGSLFFENGEKIAVTFNGKRYRSMITNFLWLPRSCDLRPLDFFLWDYLKLLVYTNDPATIDELKLNIERQIREIRPDLLNKVIEIWTDRI